ncbi:unnamed protein product, partial [Phaeothamnion confervicola]
DLGGEAASAGDVIARDGRLTLGMKYIVAVGDLVILISNQTLDQHSHFKALDAVFAGRRTQDTAPRALKWPCWSEVSRLAVAFAASTLKLQLLHASSSSRNAHLNENPIAQMHWKDGHIS